MSDLDRMIHQAVEEQRALKAEQLRREEDENKRIIQVQIEKLRQELDRKLSPELLDTLYIRYDYGDAGGYMREGFACAYAVLTVKDETADHDDALYLVVHEDRDMGHVRWMLMTPERARYGIKAFDAEMAQRNLLLAIHDWQTGDHLHED